MGMTAVGPFLEAHVMAEGQEQTELVRRARSRDQAAITRLYGLYGGTVFGIARRMLGSVEDAEDVVQDVFLGLPAALATFQGRGSLEGWVKKVTVRTVLMKQRKRRTFQKFLHKNLGAVSSRATVPRVLDHLTVDDAVAKLPESWRVVWTLKLEGYAHHEIARMLGITASASTMRFYRACKRLREVLDY